MKHHYSIVSVATLVAGICASRASLASAACGDNLPCNTGSTPALRVNNSTGPGISGTGNAGDPGIEGFGSIGVQGTSGGSDGVQGISTFAAGNAVHGTNSATASGGIGVRGDSTNGYGVYGASSSSTKYGVIGENLSGGIGVYGNSNSSDGVHGQSSSGVGVAGASTSSIGVEGVTTGATSRGVWGFHYSSTGVGYGVYGQTASPSGYGVYGQAATGGFAGYFQGNLKVAGEPYCTTQTTFTLSSDARLKKNIEPMSGALDRLLKLQGVTFEWKNPEDHGDLTGRQRGFIAQDVEKVFPDWVGVDSKGFKTVTTRGLEPMLVESLRTLKTENDLLRKRVDALEGKRPTAAAGIDGNGLLGFGLIVLGSAIIVSRRRSSVPQA